MFFASVLAMVVSSVIVIIAVVLMITSMARSFKNSNVRIASGNVLLLDLGKTIHETGESNSLAALSNEPAYDASLFDIVRYMNFAKKDNDIKGLVIKLDPSPNGWATLQQLRSAVADFKTSGKFVYAYGEDITQGAYFVATAGDSIYLNPAGGIELKGLSTVLTFFKGTLDKLELQPEIFYAGKFKSATEPFRAEKMSDPNREQIARMQKGIWSEFLAGAAEFAHTSADTVDGWSRTGSVQFPSDALRYKLVSGLLYSDELEQRIRKKTGEPADQDIRYISIQDYVAANRLQIDYSGNQIAILNAEGDIVDGEQRNEHEIAAQSFVEEIRKLRRDNNVKAVVLRINSPGGSALASEIILRELMLLKQKKHLIVSMGDYAASGGYYIASAADSIFAQPNTITGSIGVFSMMFSIDKLMKDKLGVTFDGEKTSPYADVPTASRPLTADEAQRMQNSVDTIYSLFKRHVSEGRHIAMADVDSIAQGRVWTGSDALKIHLVDRLAGLNPAVMSAAKMAGISDFKVVSYPAPEDKFNMLIKKFKSNTAASTAMKSALKEELGAGYQWYERLQSYKRMNGKVLMLMPFTPSVN